MFFYYNIIDVLKICMVVVNKWLAYLSSFKKHVLGDVTNSTGDGC